MEYLVGLVLCLAVGGLAAAIGFDRDRAFYPTMFIVIAALTRVIRTNLRMRKSREKL
jgi:hypothetical protein